MRRHSAEPRDPDTPPAVPGRRRSAFGLLTTFRWRLAFVVILCLVVATEVLAQPDVFEYWSLAAIASGLADYYLQCLCYAVAILFTVAATERMLPRLPPAARPFAIGVAILFGAAVGGLLDVYVNDLGIAYVETTRFLGDVLRWGTTGGVIVGIYAYHLRASATAARVHEAAVEQVALDRQMLEARLQVMRAQIEPHFLFNSLANAKRLCQSDLGRGLTMLENLARYLRAALPQLRAGATTLGQEADLVQAYLGILQIRMGNYLAYLIDVPEDVRDVQFPPMMLLTLAENAIKHGLAPSQTRAGSTSSPGATATSSSSLWPTPAWASAWRKPAAPALGWPIRARG